MKKNNDIDLKLVQTFCVLMASRSVSEAAIQMGITQSAMSHILGRLREQFGDKLLIRKGSAMCPTQRAEEIYLSIKEPIQAIKAALGSEVVFDPLSCQQTFVLGTTDYFEALVLPVVSSRLQKEAPGITLKCRNIEDNQLSQLGQGLDFVFGHFRKAPGNLHRATLWREDFVSIVSKKHPKIQRAISLEQLLEEQHVLISPSGSGRSMLDKILQRKRLQRSIRVFTSSFVSPMFSVMNTTLIAMAPRRLAKLFESELQILEPPLKMPTFDLHMLWSPLANNSASHRWLRQLISNATRDL